MPSQRIPFGDISLSSVLAGVQRLRGGRRLNEMIAKFTQALAERDTFKDLPLISSVDKAVSLGGAVTDIQVAGSDFLVSSQDSAKQAVASLVVWDDGAGNFVTVYSRVPGKIGNNILLTIAAPGAAGAVDSDTGTDAPKVTWTPAAGDVDASITALNDNSKLLWAEKTATGGTIAALAETALAGGVGEGVKLYLGEFLAQDASAAGATFIGSANGTFIQSWQEDKVVLTVNNADLAPGFAVPTGFTALTAVEAHLLLRLEWVRPLFEAHFPLAVAA